MPAILAKCFRTLRCRSPLDKAAATAARLIFLTLVLLHASANAQLSEAEHQSHHPAAAPPNTAQPNAAVPNPASPMQAGTSPAPPAQASPAGMGGMAGMMEGMMEGMMGEGKRKEIYPSLMGVSQLSPEKSEEIELLAEKRIHEGMELLQTAQIRLVHAIEAGDHEAAERALELFREGQAQVASGVAAHRLIREGKSPSGTALQWFRENMGLPAPAVGQHGLFGLTWFHYLAMAFLVLSVVVMLGIYYYKSRRTARLLKDLGTAKPAASLEATRPPATAMASPSASIHPDIAPSKSNSWTGPMLVARVFQETPQVKTFRLVDPAGGKLPFNYLPGQFLTLTVSPNGKPVKRSYTIASSPTHRDFCDVTVRHENQGLVSGYLHQRVHEGELLQVTAPSGKFTFAGQDADSIVLIGGGVGVTPMMSVIRYLTDRSWPGDMYLIYGCKNDTDIIFREELEYLMKRYANLHIRFVVEEVQAGNWPHSTGRITQELLAEAIPNIAAHHIHLCGPKPMMEAVKGMLANLGVPPSQVETEVFVGKEKPQETPAAAAQPPAAQEEAVAPQAKIHFSRSQKTISTPASMTVLEAAEEAGVEIDYSCRSGTCGVCKVKLLSGDVTMEVDDSLEAADKAQGIVLACQAKPRGDLTIDA